MNDMPNDILTDQVKARIAAATVACELLRGTDGIGKSPAPGLVDLILLTDYLLTGSVDPGVFLPAHQPLDAADEIVRQHLTETTMSDPNYLPWWATVPAIQIDGPNSSARTLDRQTDRPRYYWIERHSDEEFTFERVNALLSLPRVHATETDPV